jgi:bifunctional non-homologous end joining protein LigD
MLPTLVGKPIDKSGWVYEVKYDGDRILAYKEGRKVKLLSRNGKDRTGSFSNVAKAVANLRDDTLLLDGEVVAFDRRGISRFQLLQQLKSEPRYAVFDCLYKDGVDLRRAPLAERRAALEMAVKTTFEQRATVFVSAILRPNGLKAFEAASRKGLEGMVGKDESAPYIEGRSKKWLKVKVRQEEEFLIVGFTAPAGARKHFGALLLGAYDRGELRYVGKVGTGFTQESLASLLRAFRPYVTKKPSVIDPPKEKDVTYMTPRLIAQIAFEEMTAGHKLRQPVFLGLRDDKNAAEVTLPEAN